MNIKISGHHIEVTPALREYVLSKFDRVARHIDGVADVTIILSVEKLKEKERRQTAQATLRVKGCDIVVAQSHEDLYAAIDQLMNKLDRQVVDHNRRAKDQHPGRCLKREGGICHDEEAPSWFGQVGSVTQDQQQPAQL